MKPVTPLPSALRALLAALVIALAIPAGLAAAGEKAAYAIGVDGLSCPFCAYGLEKQLSRIVGVETVLTDIESGTVAVNMAEGAALGEAAAANAVEDAGFTMRSFERKAVGE